MTLEDLTTIDQLEDFLSGTQAVAFSVISDKDACYRWIEGELIKFQPVRGELLQLFAKSDEQQSIDSCHGPDRKLYVALLAYARHAFFQVQGQGPVGFLQAGGGRPVNVLHLGDWKTRWVAITKSRSLCEPTIWMSSMAQSWILVNRLKASRETC